MYHWFVILEECALEHADCLFSHGYGHGVSNGHLNGKARRPGNYTQIHAFGGSVLTDIKGQAGRGFREPGPCDHPSGLELRRCEDDDGEIWDQFLPSDTRNIEQRHRIT